MENAKIINMLLNDTDKNLAINKDFIEEFADTLFDVAKLISLHDANKWIGFKKKQTIKDILHNEKYKFVNNVDYKIEIYKPETGRPGEEIFMTIDTIKNICLMAQNEKGHEFRKYYIEMEKLFRMYVSTSIQNQLTNPIPQINKYDFDVNAYIGKEILYLLYIKDDIYKFGITNDVIKRFQRHKNELEYDYVVKCWDCKNRSISTQIENAVKTYIRLHKLNFIYKQQTEIIKINDMNPLIKMFDNYVTEQVKEYNDHFKNEEIGQRIKLIEKITELQRNEFKMIEKQCELITNANNIKNDNIVINIGSTMQNKIIFDMNSLLQLNNSSLNKCVMIQDGETIKMETVKCSDCKKEKMENDFNINEKTNTIYKTCTSCVDMRKIKSENNKGQKHEYYEKNKDTINDKNKKYYDENKIGIIEQKQAYYNKRKNRNTDETKAYCCKCNGIKDNIDFGVNPKTYQQYKQCQVCREKDNKTKRIKNKVK